MISQSQTLFFFVLLKNRDTINRNICRNLRLRALRLPVSKKSVKLNDGLLFLQTELSSFNVWSEVISPPQSAAFPTSLKP